MNKYVKDKDFNKALYSVAIPVALQTMLSSSFSVVDQIMIGQLGSTDIAGVGLAGRFASLHGVVSGAIATVAGIMIAQYMGKKSRKDIEKSISVNILLALITAVIFTAVSLFFPSRIMSLYTEDVSTLDVAAGYLSVIAFTFVMQAVQGITATILRCMNKASFTLFAGIASAVINTFLNYLLIFGKFGVPAMGVKGAAIATVCAQCVYALILTTAAVSNFKKVYGSFRPSINLGADGFRQYLSILLPILITEFLWGLGENVYSTIYGHLGTEPCAAMTLISPVIVLTIGALSGVSQAAGIIIGKLLGKGDYDEAYEKSKLLMFYGLVCALILSFMLIILKKYYVNLYQVDDRVKTTAIMIMVAFATVSPIKTLNMILGGGILRSGGVTKLLTIIDTIGTWGFGVPLGLLSAYVWNLTIPNVYFLLSLEELVRLLISLFIFRKRIWMNSLKTTEEKENG